MKQAFVIDENVAIAAATLRRPDGARDLTSAQLIRTIVKNCHRLPWTPGIYGRWSNRAQQLQTQRVAVVPSFMQFLALAQVVDGKCPIPDEGDLPPLPEEASWSTKLADDRDFIRLAAHFRCFLVTYDHPLRSDIATLGLDRAYGFTVVTPDEALPYADKPT